MMKSFILKQYLVSRKKRYWRAKRNWQESNFPCSKNFNSESISSLLIAEWSTLNLGFYTINDTKTERNKASLGEVIVDLTADCSRRMPEPDLAARLRLGRLTRHEDACQEEDHSEGPCSPHCHSTTCRHRLITSSRSRPTWSISYYYFYSWSLSRCCTCGGRSRRSRSCRCHGR
jgi:hypothetical protein